MYKKTRTNIRRGSKKVQRDEKILSKYSIQNNETSAIFIIKKCYQEQW